MVPERVLNYSKDSGLCYQRNLYSDDSVYIIRDTFLFYGDNALANKTKDSVIYNNIKNKIKVAKQLNGIAKLDITVATKFYLSPGDTVFVDAYNGLPPNRWIGTLPSGRYLTVQPGNAIIIKSKTDKAQNKIDMAEELLNEDD